MLRVMFSLFLLVFGVSISGCSLLTLQVQEERPRQLTLQELMPYMMRLKPQAKEALDLVRVSEVHKVSTGAGIGIAVIDDFDDEGPDSHGLMVSAVVKAVAPSAAIYKYDLDFNEDLADFWLEVHQHMRDIIKMKDAFDIRVVNISFSDGSYHASPCTLSDLPDIPWWFPPDRNWVNFIKWTKSDIEQAIDKGIFVVAAAGNMDLIEQFVSWQQEKFLGAGLGPELPFPACMNRVITVGAVYDSNQVPEGYESTFKYDACLRLTQPTTDEPTCYSFLSDNVDFLAPGSFWEVGQWQGGRSLEGTSFAAPTVAGIAALLLAIKDMSPDELRRTLEVTGKYIEVTVLGHNWKPKTIQITRVDAWAAVCDVSPESCMSEPEPSESLAVQYDKNQDGKIDDDEILIALNDWIQKKLDDEQIMQLLSCFITNRDVKSC